MKRGERSELIARLKKSISSAKSDLISIERQLREISETEADKLSKIIGRLETYQNARP